MQEKKHVPPPAFDQFFHALPGLYLVMTPDFIVVDATHDFLQATFTTRELIAGKHIFEIFPNNPAKPELDAVQELRQSLMYVLQHKKPHKMSTIHYDIIDRTNPDENFVERCWDSANFPIIDANGNVSHILHETRDLTELNQLKQREESIKEHLSLLENAVRAVNWDHDLVSDTICWGNGLSEIFGYTPGEMGTGLESWTSRIHADDLQSVVKSLAQAIRGKVWAAQYRFRKASGTYAHILDQGYILHDTQGNAIKIIGSMIDVSASKQAEQALKESDNRFVQLIDALPQMAWTADSKGRVLYFNQNWYSYTGMKPGQTEGWINVVHPEDSPIVLSAWEEAFEIGFYQIEYRIRNYLDGTFKWFLGHGVPIRNDDGKIILWLGVYTDVDEQKQTKESL